MKTNIRPSVHNGGNGRITAVTLHFQKGGCPPGWTRTSEFHSFWRGKLLAYTNSATEGHFSQSPSTLAVQDHAPLPHLAVARCRKQHCRYWCLHSVFSYHVEVITPNVFVTPTRIDALIFPCRLTRSHPRYYSQFHDINGSILLISTYFVSWPYKNEFNTN